ncbi:tetraacyldisaccharide 4'-kinase [Aromatoleum anaerobium]|uniref:Tetraacyldisaccharide 4'-kinase n=1 Tax=Aromatoleum anaerobium TaxID=182180 RepID=A0ABX1PNG7_9RHOO|nr:tetraacyldisaccharide 4'-kinase [Aromatoleum anaerobium]MCK0506309.1 tetraacyldisaccharide 4'-kinase [Aromatoleum anaerobium]
MPRNAPAFWQTRSLAAVLLLPLSGLFLLLATARRQLFKLRIRRAVRLPVPVVVVGNIAVGGSGKTPVVEWLVARLREAGFTPGIVSRGYGSEVAGVVIVPPHGDARQFGDEPVLLARLTACPVAVGADRPAVAFALLQAHPECDVIVADDGLQHYPLARDVEIAVVDERTLGNRWLLPAGPLREGPGRLGDVDMIVAHGAMSPALSSLLDGRPVFAMHLEGGEFRRLDGSACCNAEAFRGRRVHALAGIGRPERFFAQLAGMGLDVVPHPFPDHHPFTAADLDFAPGEPKILTSKDAVKCASFASADTWEFPVKAHIAAGAAERILEKLTHGRPTA